MDLRHKDISAGHKQGMASNDTNQQIDAWLGRLADFRDNIKIEPLSNPIRRLAFRISRGLEKGDITQEQLSVISKELCDRALVNRAERMRDYLGELDTTKRGAEIEELVRRSAVVNGTTISFEEFCEKWSKPRQGIVFTAHPTFVMSQRLRSVLVSLVEDRPGDREAALEELKSLVHQPDSEVTLVSEHVQVQDAIQNGKVALGMVNKAIVAVARELYPERWGEFTPNPVEVNSWVGYDLDGRTDINWWDSFGFRLQEKHQQLESHLNGIREAKADTSVSSNAAVNQILDELSDMIQKEHRRVGESVAAFSEDLTDPETLSRSANALTTGRKSAISVSMNDACALVDKAMEQAQSDNERAVLVRLKTRFSNHGLGTSKIHIRINSMQLHNAIRQLVGMETFTNISSRTLLKDIDQMIADVDAKQVNFASLAVERTTAVRQFICIAQILKHVDADAPIRMLIAECEHPFTVLAALYYTRLFGVEDKVDISPLLETELALEKGARIIETLLKSEQYREQVRRRGRLCVQTGFSDAGRFIGQIPAALAIEKLHAQLALVVAEAGLDGVEILIYDTHGESMGRGTHPASLEDRFAYNLSPWVRQRYLDRKIDLHHEVSFQGGDGYALFGTPSLAMAVITELLKSAEVDEESCRKDRFYIESDFSHDFFEHIKSYQSRLFDNENYHSTLGSFGTNLLSKSGSRKSKRQFDAGRDSRAAPAEMRAIPHNALLQQLGYVLNVVSGVGVALKYQQDRFADLYDGSDRVQRIIKMVLRGKQLSSIKTLVAYASLFDDAYWATRPLNELEPNLKDPCLLLAEVLRGDERHDGMMHLATFLRDDAVRLHDLLRTVSGDVDGRLDGRDELDLLHAIRIALIQHIYLTTAKVPRIATRNDISFKTIITYVLGMHVEEAVTQLREAFPTDRESYDSFALEEPASYSCDSSTDFEEINKNMIDPISSAYKTVLEIGVGISHHYGAHG